MLSHLIRANVHWLTRSFFVFSWSEFENWAWFERSCLFIIGPQTQAGLETTLGSQARCSAYIPAQIRSSCSVTAESQHDKCLSGCLFWLLLIRVNQDHGVWVWFWDGHRIYITSSPVFLIYLPCLEIQRRWNKYWAKFDKRCQFSFWLQISLLV